MISWNATARPHSVQLGGTGFAIGNWFEAAPVGEAVALSDILSARALVETLLHDASNAGVLRELAFAEPGSSDMDDKELLDWLSRNISEGRLWVVRLPAMGLGSFGEPAVAEPMRVTDARRIQDWIEIVLVDDENNPVGGVPYEIKLPDGSTRIGTTSGAGIVRFTDIDPGQCEFSFTSLDESAWRFA